MPKKVTKFVLQLEVHAVTCPGVWLCPDGQVSLRMKLFKEVAETECLAPVFPICFHHVFVFQKYFPDIYFLTEMQNALRKEKLNGELVQWPSSGDEIVLATFNTTLLDLLYPNARRKTPDIDLLMQPTDAFPGIIAPKVEISTKTIVEEVPVSFGEADDLSVSTVVNQKDDLENSALNTSRRPLKTQRKVCHSLGIHEKKADCSLNMTLNESMQNGKQMPFSLRDVDVSRISGLNESMQKTPRKSRRRQELAHSSANWTPVPRQSHKTDEFPKFISPFTSRRKNTSVIIIDPGSHESESCLICSRYKALFEDADSSCAADMMNNGSITSKEEH